MRRGMLIVFLELAAELVRLKVEILERKQHGHNLSEVEYRIVWAKSYLKQAGYLTQSKREVWALGMFAS
jgi:restriction endonuclease Mrr